MNINEEDLRSASFISKCEHIGFKNKLQEHSAEALEIVDNV